MSVFRPARVLPFMAALAVTLGACGGGGGGGEPAKVATSITISPGPNAGVQSGGTLQLIATVKDQNGNPMTGQTVTWSTSNPSKATVSATGLVTGIQVGATTINASVGTTLFASPPVTVIVTAGAPATVVKVAELATTMASGSSDSVRVRVTDAQGNLVAGVTVNFSVSGGGSTLSSTTAVTNSAGVAAVQVTIGNAFNQVTTVTASVTGFPAVTFTTTSVAGPPTQLRITSPKIVIIDQGTTTTITVTLADAAGNSVSSTGLVDFIARSNAATTSGATVNGVSPGQTFIIAQLSSNPAVRDSVLVVVAFLTGPVIRTDLSRFDLKADTTFTVPIIVDMRTSGEKLGSTRVQITWNPAVLIYQSDAEGASSVGATVNNTSAGTGSLTLAVASATGFSGSVEVRRITFRATATVAQTTSITLIATELNGISPNFTNLKPKTLGVVYPIITR